MEVEEKMKKEGLYFLLENMKDEEVCYILYKNYIVSVYRLTPIVEGDNIAGSFENVYVVYDIENDKVYNEYTPEKIALFDELPEIDNVLFKYDFENEEEVEGYKKVLKGEVINFYNNKEITPRYLDALEKIYNVIDESSKEFFEFFINAAK